MSTLLAVVFEEETTALEMCTTVQQMAADASDSVALICNRNGIVEISEAPHVGAAGRALGGFWRLFIALLFLNLSTKPAAARFTYLAMDDAVMRQLAESMKPGTSALFLLAQRATADAMLERLGTLGANGKIFRSSLGPDHEAALRAALERAA